MPKYYITDREEGFEELEEIYDVTFQMDFESGNLKKEGFPIISDGKQGCGYFLEQPMMILANTGAGKTTRLVLPYILSSIYAGSSLVITDPKAELLKYTKKILEEKGYDIQILDYRNLKRGKRYNLCKKPSKLWQEGDTDRADEMFQAMFDTMMERVKSTNDTFWADASASYMTGLAELACDILPSEDVTLENIYELHLQGQKRFGASPTTILRTYLDMHSDEPKPYHKLLYPYVSAAAETKASLDATLGTGISRFVRNDGLCDQSLDSDFEVSDMVEKKTAVFIISRDESTVYNPIISNIIDQIYGELIDLAEEKFKGCLKRRVSFCLEEFGNLTAIKDIDTKVTACRSRNIGFLFCCQSLNQLEYIYGKDLAKIILGNCNIAYMYSTDISLVKMISDLCGNITDEYTNEKRPLLSVEKLRHFNKKEGETLFLLERMRPFISYMPYISEYGISPIEVDIPKRIPKKRQHPNFEKLVLEERKKRKEKLDKEMAEALSKNNQISPQIWQSDHEMSFELWKAMKRKQAEDAAKAREKRDKQRMGEKETGKGDTKHTDEED